MSQFIRLLISLGIILWGLPIAIANSMTIMPVVVTISSLTKVLMIRWTKTDKLNYLSVRPVYVSIQYVCQIHTKMPV